MVTVKGTETKSTHLSASIVKGGILSKWSGDKSGGAQDHIPFKFIFDGFNSVRFWHIAAIEMVAHRHGVSGVGGSNPLVPTKNPRRTSLLGLVFLCLFSERGSNGE